MEDLYCGTLCGITDSNNLIVNFYSYSMEDLCGTLCGTTDG